MNISNLYICNEYAQIKTTIANFLMLSVQKREFNS